MPDLRGLGESLKNTLHEDLASKHNEIIGQLKDKYLAHAEETGRHIAGMYANKAREYLQRSQTGRAFFSTGHAIAREHLESVLNQS